MKEQRKHANIQFSQLTYKISKDPSVL